VFTANGVTRVYLCVFQSQAVLSFFFSNQHLHSPKLTQFIKYAYPNCSAHRFYPSSRFLCAIVEGGVVSDTASSDASTDKSGPTIRAILGERGGFECSHVAIVPEELLRIQDTVKQWVARGDIDLILTTGGTGFNIRDVTPEVLFFVLRHV
jgi:hypothetical protein